METVQEKRKSQSKANGFGVGSFFSPSPVQPKLTIGPVDDPYEREADAVAERVMRMSDTETLQTKRAPLNIQRKCAACEEKEKLQRKEDEEEPVQLKPRDGFDVQRKCEHCEEKEKSQKEEIQRRPETHISLHADDEDGVESTLIAKHRNREPQDVSTETTAQLFAFKGGGIPLPKNIQSEMELAFGVNLSDVRIHTDQSAVNMSRNMGAQAFTHGSDIYFNSGKFDTRTYNGKKLLIHELTHVVQQSKKILLKPETSDNIPNFLPVTPKQISIKKHIDFFKKVPLASQIENYFLVEKNRLKIFNKNGNVLSTFSISRPIVDINGYYIGSPFNSIGWTWISETTKNNYETIFLNNPILYREIAAGTTIGKFFEQWNEALLVIDWIRDKDLSKFWDHKRGLTGMIILSSPSTVSELSPRLIFELPDWFKEIEKGINEKYSEEKKINPENPQLPQSITYYGSKGVQKTKGKNAWTIQVNKNKKKAFYTILKESYEEATSKESYINHVWQVLLNKIKLLNAEKEITEKEIAEIDGSGNKISAFAWAYKLKEAVEVKLARQKKLEPTKSNFPFKLSFSTIGDGDATKLFFKVHVQIGELIDPSAEPEIKTAIINIPVTQGDSVEFWASNIREICEFLKSKKIIAESFDKVIGDSDQSNPSPEDFLPPYPANIVALGRINDRKTTDSATNIFRMVLNMEAIHGNSLLNLATIAWNQIVSYRWSVFKMPDEIKTIHEDPTIKEEEVLQETNNFVNHKKGNLETPSQTFNADLDWDQNVKLPKGHWIIAGSANVQNKSDGKRVRYTSRAGYPMSVVSPGELLDSYVNEESGQNKTEAKKEFPEITSLRINETEKLIYKVTQLKKFIQERRKNKIPEYGNEDHDPLSIAIASVDKILSDIYFLIKQMYGYSSDDIYAIDEFLKDLQNQKKELEKLQKRTTRLLNNKEIHPSSPKYRTVSAILKETEGQLIPINLIACWHKDSKINMEDPSKSKYKIMLFDVTFDSPSVENMIYVGETENSEKAALQSAFVEFGIKNHYGDGKIGWNVPALGFSGKAESVTKWYEYLESAIAVVGIVLLIGGAILSFGSFTPAAIAGISAIVTALSISVAVVGAIFAARNIYNRYEKGTLKMDASLALDVVSIIGAAILPLGLAAKAFGTAARVSGTINNMARIQRLDRLIHIYDWVEIGVNGILVNKKVEEDLEAIKLLGLSDEDTKKLEEQVAMEALQQNAMLIVGAFAKGKETSDMIATRVENSRYKSFIDKGFIDFEGKLTDKAPPFMHEAVKNKLNNSETLITKVEPGVSLPTKEQGNSAWNEANLIDLAKADSVEPGHQITVTERGRIIRCSDFCTDLRLKYGKILSQDPSLEIELTRLEQRAKSAGENKSKLEAEKIAKESVLLEAKMIEYEKARQELFGGTQDDWNILVQNIEEAKPGSIKGGRKPKIDGVTIPTKQRRLLDVTDLMTHAEKSEKGGFKKAMDRVGTVISKKISDVDPLRHHWEAVKESLMKGKTAEQIGRRKMLKFYETARKKFWESVRADPEAVDFLKQAGFVFEGKGAPVAVLGPNGKRATQNGSISDQERRISLDHIVEKAQGENWKKALEADNLEFMFQNANSWKEIVQVRFKMRVEAPELPAPVIVDNHPARESGKLRPSEPSVGKGTRGNGRKTKPSTSDKIDTPQVKSPEKLDGIADPLTRELVLHRDRIQEELDALSSSSSESLLVKKKIADIDDALRGMRRANEVGANTSEPRRKAYQLREELRKTDDSAPVGERHWELDPMPDATVMQDANPTDSKGSELMYKNSIAHDPLREAALYRNTETGEFIIVQGQENFASVGNGEAPMRGGSSQPWKELLNSGQDLGNWELQAHYHPLSPKSGDALISNLIPSGADGDIGVIVIESIIAGGTPRTSRIDYRLPDGTMEYSLFSFFPDTKNPIVLDLPLLSGTKGRYNKSFPSVEAYHAWASAKLGGSDMGPISGLISKTVLGSRSSSKPDKNGPPTIPSSIQTISPRVPTPTAETPAMRAERLARGQSMEQYEMRMKVNGNRESNNDFARHGQTFSSIFKTLRNKQAELIKDGQKHLLPEIDGKVLQLTIDHFILQNPVLMSHLTNIINGLRRSPKGVRNSEGWIAIRDNLLGGDDALLNYILTGKYRTGNKQGIGSRLVGARIPDLVMFDLINGRVHLVDWTTDTMGKNTPHNFKTRFYVEVLRAMLRNTGPKVSGRDIRIQLDKSGHALDQSQSVDGPLIE